jgi:hypothetical protein
MKKKQKLSTLEVQSFVTSLTEDKARQLKGASGIPCDVEDLLTIGPNCIGISQGAQVCTRDSCCS